MNNIAVQGGTARQRAYVESITEFCIQKLMPRMKTLDITIKLTKPKGAYGYCLCEDIRTFEIEVDNTLKLRRLLETVAHEMVHVKQYARKELNEYTSAWQGKLISSNTEYWDRPWEIEAHGREVGLFVRWAEQNKLANKKWTHDA
jgi:hypothetical protein